MSARLGKQKNLVLILLAVIAAQFVGLAALLLSGGGAQSTEITPSPQEPQAPAEEEAPAEEAMPAWLAPAPQREKEPPAGELTAPEILSDAQLITHGMGAIGGETVLNCLEGFLAQYEKGVRVFEVDLRMTQDMQVVLRHDWRAGWQEGVSETAVPTLEEFLDKPVLGQYTPLSFRDLLLLMEEYPDVCIITDSKFIEAEIIQLQFEAMLRDARELGLSYLFGRMIIQVYSQLTYQIIDSIHHFPYYIYTLYAEGFARTEEAFRETAAFCADSGILGITLWDYWWREEYAPIAQEYGVTAYTHTVNDAAEALSLLESGVSAVYTDLLVPGDLQPEAGDTSTEQEGEISDGIDGEDTVQ